MSLNQAIQKKYKKRRNKVQHSARGKKEGEKNLLHNLFQGDKDPSKL